MNDLQVMLDKDRAEAILWARSLFDPDGPDLSAEEADEVSDALEFAFGALEQAVAEAEGRS